MCSPTLGKPNHALGVQPKATYGSNQPRDSCTIGMHPEAKLASIGGSHIGGTPILALSIVGDSIMTSVCGKEPYLHHGDPALVISSDDEASLAEPFKFTLVGKFSHCKPKMVEIRSIFQKFGFCDDFKLGLIDYKHILIHLTHEYDYNCLFLKPLWFIDGCPISVLKWTRDFYSDAETSIVHVWISFPLLLVHLCANEFLFALSKIVGVPLRIDETTADLLRPSEAMATKPFVTPTSKFVVALASKPIVVPANKCVDAPMPIVYRAGKGKEKEIVVKVPRQWDPVAGSSSVVTIPPPMVHVGPTLQLIYTILSIVASKPFHDRAPLVGSYKVNTDGCVKDRFASGGVIIRDSLGQCVRAFFSSYRECPILEAESRTILDDIILVQRIVLSNLWIETDFTLAIHCITRGGGPWSIQDTLHHIRHLLAFDRDTIFHIYCEGNQVANLLSLEGWDLRCYFEYNA
ncbi:Uncharacterized protein Adt_12514 [Abeliophyllum distichum]|uniref:DUF4283 domain-containing protein n=1 Tax=Abeliophyllum distichum TaxID=126358 RepID=A0ABD1UQZ4_9LAMI